MIRYKTHTAPGRRSVSGEARVTQIFLGAAALQGTMSAHTKTSSFFIKNLRHPQQIDFRVNTFHSQSHSRGVLLSCLQFATAGGRAFKVNRLTFYTHTVKRKNTQSQQIWLLFSSGMSGVSSSRWGVLKSFNNGSKLPYFSNTFLERLISFMGGSSAWHVEPISLQNTAPSTPLPFQQQKKYVSRPNPVLLCFSYNSEQTCPSSSSGANKRLAKACVMCSSN